MIVSGSSANLANLQVDSLSSGLVTGASGNLTTTAINGTGNIVATTNATSLIHSGSFSGSFEGDGSGLTGVVAEAANALTDGAGILDFSYNGNAAGVQVSVDSGSLAGNGLTTSGGKIVVNPSSSLITVGSDGVGVNLANLTVDDATLQLNSGTTYDGGVAKTISIKDNGVDTDAIAHSLGTIGVHQFTGSFSGSFTGDVDINLDDLTAGAGLYGSAYDGNAARTFSVNSGSLAGTGLGADSTGLIVNVDDSTIEIDTDTLRVKASGIGTSQIANDAVTTDKIAHSLGTLGTHQFTGSFSGSFAGDGSGLTGIASTLTVDGDSGTQDVGLLTDDLQILGTTNEIVTAITKVGTDVKATIGLPDDVTIGQDLTITRDVNIQRNLVVQGTASFQHREDYDVADRFIRLASGSTAAGDGGIVIQQASAAGSDIGYGETFGFDAANLRFGVTSSFDASTEAFVPDAFMVNVIEGAANDPNAVAAKYDKKGNIFVANNEDIYIYS